MQRIKQLLKAVLNELNLELYLTNANDKIPDNCKYPLALNQAPQNQKQTKSGGLSAYQVAKRCCSNFSICNIR